MNKQITHPIFSPVYGEQLNQLDNLDLFSQEFIFKREHAEARNFRSQTASSPTWRPLLSILLHEEMNIERRAAVFPGRFDLGNLIDIPNEKCTYAKLLEDLPKLESDEPFEAIKQGVKRLTGKGPHEFFKIDKTNTLKVIKTLFVFSKARRNTIFSTLSAPESGKSGMEFRDAYPHERADDFTYQISDLRERV